MLELPKLRDAFVAMDEPALAAWCRFLAAETDEEREALVMQHQILKEAKDALGKLSVIQMRESGPNGVRPNGVR